MLKTFIDLLPVAANFVLVGITFYYARTTHRMQRTNDEMLAAMHKQNTALSRPYITANVSDYPGRHLWVLQIVNVGKSGAENLRLTLDRDFFRFGPDHPKYNLRMAPAFQNVIPWFGSGAKLEFELGSGNKQYDPDDPLTPAVFSITAEYYYERTPYSAHCQVDLRQFTDGSYSYDPIQHELAQVNENLKKLVDRR